MARSLRTLAKNVFQRGARPRTARGAPRPIVWERLPPLALMATLAAIADLAINRFAVRIGIFPHQLVFVVQRWGEFFLNLAAVTGLVSLISALWHFLADRSVASAWRRITIALMGGSFTTLATMACLMPAEGAAVTMGPLTAIAGATLVTHLSLSGVGSAHRPTMLACSLMTVVGLLMLIHASVSLLAPALGGVDWMDFRDTVGKVGEISYLSALLSVVAFLPEAPETRRSQLLGVAAITTTAFFAIAFVSSQQDLGFTFVVLLEGALDVRLFADLRPEIYALWISVVAGASVVGLLHPRAVFRQATCALLLILAAGHFPRTPSRVLMLVLGSALLARSAVALRHRRPATHKGTPEPI